MSEPPDARPAPAPSGGVEDVVDAYLAAWNERDPARRELLLSLAVTDDCELCSPNGTFRGRAAILGLIAGLQGRMAGAVTERSGPVEGGADIRFRWQVRRSNGDPVMRGVDVVQTAADGRLSRISVAI